MTDKETREKSYNQVQKDTKKTTEKIPPAHCWHVDAAGTPLWHVE